MTNAKPNGPTVGRILAPVDFSTASREGLRLAGMVAGQFGGVVDLLYAVEPLAYPEWGYAHVPKREAKLRKAAAEKLPQFSLECGVSPSLVRTARVCSGRADWEIVKAAREENTALIVIATHGMSTLKHTLLGSTAERVVRHAPCPVLTMRERLVPLSFPDDARCLFKRILLPTDFSEASKKAIPYAAAFAARCEATLVLVHVVPSTWPAEVTHIGIVLEEKRLIAEAQKRLPQFRQSELDASLRVETHVLNGGPAHEIAKGAEELNCDLVVIATHGHTGLKHFWLGSVAERVVRHTQCPVLVVREHEHEFVTV